MRIPCLYGFVAAVLAAVTVNVSAQTAARVDSTKLTTVLQTLASAVPQDDARAVAQSRTSTARITRAALPKAVQDAMATRRLRMNDANEVQVYILMSAVNDERLAQLRAGGATIEIPDAGAATSPGARSGDAVAVDRRAAIRRLHSPADVCAPSERPDDHRGRQNPAC